MSDIESQTSDASEDSEYVEFSDGLQDAIYNTFTNNYDIENVRDSKFIYFSINSLVETNESYAVFKDELIGLLENYPEQCHEELDRIVDNIIKQEDGNGEKFQEAEFFSGIIPKRRVVINDYPKQGIISNLKLKDVNRIIRFPCIVTHISFVHEKPISFYAQCLTCLTNFFTKTIDHKSIINMFYDQKNDQGSYFTKNQVNTRSLCKCPECLSGNVKLLFQTEVDPNSIFLFQKSNYNKESKQVEVSQNDQAHLLGSNKRINAPPPQSTDDFTQSSNEKTNSLYNRFNKTKEKTEIPSIIFVQKIIVKDLNSGEFITVFLFNEFVDSINLGSCLYITGIVRANENEKSQIVNFCIECMTLREIENNLVSSTFLKRNDEDIIIKMKRTPNIFPILVHSLAPNVMCSPLIKVAVLLTLFCNIDNPMNVLIISNRKDQLNSMIPFIKKVFIHATISSKDENPELCSKIKDNMHIRSGAMVKANHGLLIIDDTNEHIFQKNQLSYIEAVKNHSERIDSIRTTPISFSSIVFTSPIIQSQNAQFSSFSLTRSSGYLVNGSIEDLTGFLQQTVACFTVCCFDDSENTRKTRVIRQLTPASTPLRSFNFENWNDERLPIEKRLAIPPNVSILHFPLEELSVYAAYARLFINPCFDDETEEILQENIMDINNKLHLPHVEKNLRTLCKARAAAEIRDKVRISDVKEMTELFWSLQETIRSSFTVTDSETSSYKYLSSQKKKKGSSNRSNSKKAILHEFLRIFKEEIKRTDGRMGKVGMQSIFDTIGAYTKFECVDDLIDILSSEGFILLCPNGDYRLGSN